MKDKYFLIIWFALGIGLASCDYDNFEAPESMLQGRIVYNGEPINVGYNEVNMQLWEPGWQLKSAINVAVDQDGSYGALLFNAPYKLVIQTAQGPFRSIKNEVTQSDTIIVDLNGNQTFDIEVMPYYMIRNVQISNTGNDVAANFGLEKIITDVNAKDVENVNLYINKTMFVDRANNIASNALAGSSITDMNSINMSVTVPTLNTAQSYVFARVGIKIAGIEDMLYSPIQKIQL
ncbi:MAG: hypothetical protein COW65_18820 [Cytophagales bacterium CG18_big_fil_WC_8_21_14_2_50_42_9]|nr:MAG: hypothetical protein COW65_18820 [Cytophagales bacterium CG18_big_fil_WC_8_21_14_2_50_42_9]